MYRSPTVSTLLCLLLVWVVLKSFLDKVIMDDIKPDHGKATSSETAQSMPDDTCEQELVPSTTNLCIACHRSSRAVAFVPCAHYVTCLPCGHGLTECPVCRSKIMACVRIYE